jgi:rhamnose utilization protein RhaD (predicted bifunctional aldolase and dehydrogenase)
MLDPAPRMALIRQFGLPRSGVRRRTSASSRTFTSTRVDVILRAEALGG